MQLKTSYKSFSIFLIFSSTISFFFGFYLDENSAGAGTYTGDFQHIWKNLQIFLNNDILSSLSNSEYSDSRTPISYIIHKLFNPFVETEINFRRSVFAISLIIPFLFYVCLKKRFIHNENLLLLLLTSVIFLSPYFRTSSFWGLGENYGLIFLLLSFLLLKSFLSTVKKNGATAYINIFLLTITSSLCLYFDQKLIIIPIICLFQILYSAKPLQLKLFSILSYVILSLPYLYLIYLWGSLIPPDATESRKLGQKIFLDHIGYTLTIIAFYLLPILFFKIRNIRNSFQKFILKKDILVFIFIFIIYLFLLILFPDQKNESLLGKGYISKISLIIFESPIYIKIFTYISFFISYIIILFYINKNYVELFTFLYFIFLSVIIWPILQEYFDPILILLVFTFFNSNLNITYKNVTFLYFYLATFLIGANIYY
tara:strand:+ start:1038 stop:2321 length:1284 start_codon:yes stop_codon:yes gene_type:complete